MRYESYLLQEGRSVKISQEQAFESVKKNCDQAWQAYQNNKLFFRGLKDTNEYLFIDPKPNNFEVVTNMNNIPSKAQGNGQEMWTDGKCVMISSVLGGAGGLNPELIAYMEK